MDAAYSSVSLCSISRVHPLCDHEVKLVFLHQPLFPLLCHIQVMIAEALDITRETYFAILMDRACNGPVMVGSPQGGMDIEEVAASSPELIFKVYDLWFIPITTKSNEKNNKMKCICLKNNAEVNVD